jgi:hypothetical protein
MAAAACGPEVSYEHFWPDNAYCTVEDGVTNQGQNVPLFYMGNGVPQGGEAQRSRRRPGCRPSGSETRLR